MKISVYNLIIFAIGLRISFVVQCYKLSLIPNSIFLKYHSRWNGSPLRHLSKTPFDEFPPQSIPNAPPPSSPANEWYLNPSTAEMASIVPLNTGISYNLKFKVFDGPKVTMSNARDILPSHGFKLYLIPSDDYQEDKIRNGGVEFNGYLDKLRQNGGLVEIKCRMTQEESILWNIIPTDSTTVNYFTVDAKICAGSGIDLPPPSTSSRHDTRNSNVKHGSILKMGTRYYCVSYATPSTPLFSNSAVFIPFNGPAESIYQDIPLFKTSEIIEYSQLNPLEKYQSLVPFSPNQPVILEKGKRYSFKFNLDFPAFLKSTAITYARLTLVHLRLVPKALDTEYVRFIYKVLDEHQENAHLGRFKVSNLQCVGNTPCFEETISYDQSTQSLNMQYAICHLSKLSGISGQSGDIGYGSSSFSLGEDEDEDEEYRVYMDLHYKTNEPSTPPQSPPSLKRLPSRYSSPSLQQTSINRNTKIVTVPTDMTVLIQISEEEVMKGANVFVNKDPLCTACGDVMKVEDLAIVKGCGHSFHKDCLLRWIRKKRDSATCPLCRNEIFPKGPR